jgi:hypothetical protein
MSDIKKWLEDRVKFGDNPKAKELFEYINDLESKVKRQSPCENQCEAQSFRIEIRRLKSELEK